MEKTMLDYALEEAKDLLNDFHKVDVAPTLNENEFVINAYARNGRRMLSLVINNKAINSIYNDIENKLTSISKCNECKREHGHNIVDPIKECMQCKK